MKKFLLVMLLISSFTAMPAGLYTAVVTPIPGTNYNEAKPKPPTIKVQEIEKKIGRKLTVKEKIAFFLWKKTQKAESSKSGKTALTIGIIGAGLFILGLFIPYVILGSLAAAIVAVVLGSSAKKQNPEDRKAISAVLLGWITLGAIALVLIIAAIVVASFLSSWGG
jgi:hypothetical protein